jgi:hypothetical protein
MIVSILEKCLQTTARHRKLALHIFNKRKGEKRKEIKKRYNIHEAVMGTVKYFSHRWQVQVNAKYRMKMFHVSSTQIV